VPEPAAQPEGTGQGKVPATTEFTDYALRYTDDPLDLKRRIRWIIQLRWLVTIVVPLLVYLLGSRQVQVLVQAGEGSKSPVWPTVVLAALNFGLNGLYFLALRRSWKLQVIAVAQVLLDMVIFTSIVYSTGGAASPFTFVYFNPILTACLFFSFGAGLACAAFSSLLYGLMLYLQGAGILAVRSVFQPLAELARSNHHYLALMGVVWVYAFFLAALLTGFLARVLKKRELELRQSNAALDARVGELSLLYEVGSLINRTTSLNQVLRRTLDLLVQRLDFDRALLYLVTEDRKSLKLKLLSRHPRFAGMPPESYTVTMALNKKAGLTARAAVEKKLFNVIDPQNHPLINKDLAKRIGLNPFAVAPMLVKDKVVGVIGVDHKYRGGAISPEEARSLVIFANQAGMTIENARLRNRKA
jgi:K+-sensing histidine kinase KdpD